MKRRIVLAAVLAAVLIGVLPAWADHSRPTGINCSNFTYQEDAQDYFNLHPGDPEGLDGPIGPAFEGIENVACENLPHRPVTATTVTTTTVTSTTVQPTTTIAPTTIAPTTTSTTSIAATGGRTIALTG